MGLSLKPNYTVKWIYHIYTPHDGLLVYSFQPQGIGYDQLAITAAVLSLLAPCHNRLMVDDYHPMSRLGNHQVHFFVGSLVKLGLITLWNGGGGSPITNTNSLGTFDKTSCLNFILLL